MSGLLIGTLILWLIVAIIVIVVVVYVVNWLYHRSSKEVSFVRTGFLGERVVIDGGAFVLPFIHDFTPVNMNVLPMQIVRAEGRRPHHARPHAHRHRGRFLRPRPGHARGGLDRGLDAWPAYAGARTPARAALGQIRLRPALGRFRNDHGADARAARRLRRAREGGGGRGAGAERPRTGIGRDHRSRPDRPRILQSLEPLRRRGPDPADRGHRGRAASCATTSSRIR